MDSDNSENGGKLSDKDEIRIRKWRLSDSMTNELSKRSFPVQIPIEASFSLWRLGSDFPELGKILFALETAYGPTSRHYDDFKQSFRFPFLLELIVDAKQIHLLWNLSDLKGSIDFNFRRIFERVEDVLNRSDVIVPLDEISTRNFKYIVNFLTGWIEGYCNSFCEHHQPAGPFYRSIRSSLAVYGYWNGSFFCYQYQDYEQFEKCIADFKKSIPDRAAPPNEPLAMVEDAKAWVQRAKHESPFRD